MANPKRKKEDRPTARPRTVRDEVDHPRLAGTTEHVDRVTDTLTSMFNRRQISQLQYGAGDRYRMAHEMTSASAGGSMDFDRARGSSGISPTPALTFLLAAEITSQAKMKLYPKDFAIVHRVCVQGFSIEQAARQLYDPQWDGEWASYLREAGRKFRCGLDEMADMWWPDARTKTDPITGDEVRKMRAVRTERATVTDAPPPDRVASSVAHATRDKVYRGPQRRERV